MKFRKTASAGLLFIIGVSAGRADEIPAKYEETVRKGLAYLVKSQSLDGHWAVPRDNYPVAMTGLAGLALLMEGSTVREGKYSDNIRKAVDWLMDKSQNQGVQDGLIYSQNAAESGRFMFGHGYATLFLACAYGDEDDDQRRARLKDVLVRAVNYIGSAQSNEGGWFYWPSIIDDECSVTVTQLQALRACRHAGIPVPVSVIRKAADYLRRSTSEKGSVAYRVGQSGGRPALTAAAIACSFRVGEYKNDLAKKWLKYCQHAIPVNQVDNRLGYDEFTHYYYAQAVYNLGDDGWDKLFAPKPDDARVTWSVYRTALFDWLKARQAGDGSWPVANSGFGPGPVYSTAVFCTIMQLDRGCVPFYERAF